MAQVLKLARSGSSDINLINASGWYLTDPGWIPVVGEAGEELPAPVEEGLRIQSNFSSHDNLSAAVVALETMARLARRYLSDNMEYAPVWLHDKLNNETGERRALVRRLRLKQLAEQHGAGDAAAGSMIDSAPAYELGIEREGWWERTAASTAVTASGLSALAGAFDYTASPGADIVGDEPARIHALTLDPSALPATIWLGFRSANKHGTLANFVAVWEAESCLNLDDTTDDADNTASGNTRITVPFGAHTDWYYRSQMRLSHITANYADNFGRFQVLVRAKVSAGVADLRMKTGYRYQSSLAEHTIVRISRTSWTIYELGIINIPLEDRRAITTDILAASYDAEEIIELWARQISGGAQLHVDCVILIPIDEYGLKLQIGASVNGDVTLAVAPFGAIAAVLQSTTIYCGASVSELGGIGVPVGDGRMYAVVASVSNGHTMTDTYGATLQVVPRWAALRGSE